jgi:hypothetical protein
MAKKLSLLALTIILALGPLLPPAAQAGGKEPTEPMLPRAAFAPAASNNSGHFGLIAKKFVFFAPGEIVLTPASPTVAQTLETPALLSLTLPEDKKRTYLFIATGVLHSWDQIASTAPYRLLGSVRFSLVSSVLPAPGEIDFGTGLDQQVDAQPSASDIGRSRDQTWSFALDDEILAFLISNDFPSLTAEERLQLARALIASEVSISMKVRINVRSVSGFEVSNAFLNVWGD